MANQKIRNRTVLGGAAALVRIPLSKDGANVDYALVCNLMATTDPGVGDDTADGYCAGSLWFNTSTGRMFIALDVTGGAAVWVTYGAATRPNYIANNWYLPEDVQSLVSGHTAAGINVMKFFPTFFRERVTISALAFNVITAVAAQNAQAAIYASSPTTLKPTGNALSATADISCAVAGSVSGNLLSSVQVQPGTLYWLATNCSSASVILRALSNVYTGSLSRIYGSTSLSDIMGSSGVTSQGLTLAQTYNTWPDMTAASPTINVATTAQIPLVVFKVESIP